ncbi:AraC family transcriptional regulator [Actinobaculum sp. 313]|uniref:helix-turn-helix transcriptional regulator n=1 Tax=Actinobaculum sp. 313 TaxID=2495645 RepID=UPI0013DD8D12|nr:AraC family transcriptional regulator [Actinobaculum sp. 313]
MEETATHEVVIPTDRLSVRLVLHTGITPESFQPHWHSSFEINCMLRWPESEVLVGGRTWRMHTGRIWLANSQQIHGERTLHNDPLRRAVTILYPYPYLRRVFPAIDAGRFELNDVEELTAEQLSAYHQQLYPRFAKLAELLARDAEPAPTHYLQLSLLPLEILNILAQSFFIADVERPRTLAAEPIVRTHRIVDYVEEHYATKIRLEDLADYCHLSRGYMARFIKEHLGYTLSEYVAMVRAEHARQDLLVRRGTQSEVAALNGYSGLRTMNRQLQKIFGRTAKEILADAGNGTPGEAAARGARESTAGQAPGRKAWESTAEPSAADGVSEARLDPRME